MEMEIDTVSIFLENNGNTVDTSKSSTAVQFSKREIKEQRKLAQKKSEAYNTFHKLEPCTKEENLKNRNNDGYFSKLPRKTMIIVNLGIGQVGGVTSNEQLEGIFQGYKGFERVIIVKGKPYSFVEFRGGDDAKVARDEMHEKPCNQLGGKILFLEYINHVDFAYLTDRKISALSLSADIDTSTEAGAEASKESSRTDQIVDNKDDRRKIKVNGLYYIPDFLSQEEQDELLKEVAGFGGDQTEVEEGGEREPGKSRYFCIQNRKMQHYGHAFDYKKKHIGGNQIGEHVVKQKIPQMIMEKVINRAKEKLKNVCEGMDNTEYDQLTVQKYEPGTGISFHADSHTAFGENLLIVSLMAPIMMEFRHPSTGSLVEQDLQAGSLVVLSGDARYGWEHGIRTRRTDVMAGGIMRERKERWSLTIRSINRDITCRCEYQALCDQNTMFVRELRRKQQEEE